MIYGFIDAWVASLYIAEKRAACLSELLELILLVRPR